MDGELIRTDPSELPAVAGPEVTKSLDRMAQLMRGVADMMRTTNERMAALEQQVRMLTKVTPAQTKALNVAIADRAAELCGRHRMAGCERQVGNAIRREVKTYTGITAMRELPRCDFEVTMQRVVLWEGYKAIKAIREKEAARHGAR